MLALLGGTFDPVHHGHLRVAWEAAEQLDAEVRMLLANVPPHRPQPGARAEQRWDMLRLALQGQARLIADDRELRRVGPSYSVDTLSELRAEIGAERALILLVGADAFAGLSSWHRWRSIFELAHVGVLTRPGHGGVFEAELAAEWYARRVDSVAALHDAPAGAIAPIEVSSIELSATQIRALCAAGRSPRFLVPEAVLEYMDEHNLYRATSPTY